MPYTTTSGTGLMTDLLLQVNGSQVATVSIQYLRSEAGAVSMSCNTNFTSQHQLIHRALFVGG